MKEAKQLARPWKSKITRVEKDNLETLGIDQRTIIREFSYEEMVFFLVIGRRPSDSEKKLLRSVILSHISHGITGQSTLAVMMAADVRSGFLNAAIAGFSVGAGEFHQGGLKATMTKLQEYARLTPNELDLEVRNALSRRERIMGFGHRFHKRDPRAVALQEIAEELGHDGLYFRIAKSVEAILLEEKGIAMNIEAAGGSLLLDLGFDPQIAHLIILVGRSPMYAAAYLERLQLGLPPFPKIEVMDL
jgi:citrate synthase